ncbi:MAG: 30S ribosomal protein S6 [Deltaproteobacteria bacterium HGW-Deltaproteobacteria-17]|nr:MAG: 30S ribosomal protein S6 [Deltaproteobacteria bacterium HGW-Deltaproteobacteria-17]
MTLPALRMVRGAKGFKTPTHREIGKVMTLTRSYRDQVNNEREYEMITILAPETTSEDIKVIQRRVLDLMERKEGRLLALENWGRRRLAYTVRKHRKGIYLYWRFLGHFELVAEIERLMRMIEKVIRYMSILVDANVDPNARPESVTEEQLNQAAAIQSFDVPEHEDREQRPAETDEEDAGDAEAAGEESEDEDKE